MASLTFKLLQETQIQLSSFTHCKYSSNTNPFKFHHSFIISPLHPRISFLQVRAHVTHLEAKLPSGTHQNDSRNTNPNEARGQNSSGLSSSSPSGGGLGSLLSDSGSVVEENVEKRVVPKDRHARPRLKSIFQNRRAMGSRLSATGSKDEETVRNTSIKKIQGNEKGRGMYLGTELEKEHVNHLERVGKNSIKSKDRSPEAMFRIGLDMCSKRGDAMGAIRLYDLARKEEVKVGQYHYTVLLYLCSSAAAGVVQPAKSGRSNRSVPPLGLSKEISRVDSESICGFERPRVRNFGTTWLDNDFVVERSDDVGFNFTGLSAEVIANDSKSTLNNTKKPIKFLIGISEPDPETLDGMVQLMKSRVDHENINSVEEQMVSGIQVCEDVKKYALKRGFEIYENMLLEEVPMNEATFTSVARMAMSLGDGDMAFEIVKQMKELGISPRLRSYSPALSAFCNSGDVEKAFLVEQHMSEHGISPDEPDLQALLKVSIEAGRSDKVYYILHKLRASVRQVSPSTADLIEKWFRSNLASKVGKRKWSQKMIKEAIQNGGGGWHGQGWLGKGKWTVFHSSVGPDGFCKSCGEKLIAIDLDPAATESFARSVASLALQREKNSNFQNFQKWLDYYGPFEAVVDAANVGLYNQRNFKPSKVNAIVNGIRQMLPSKRWPLIVLHNKRITGDHRMNKPVNKALIEKWRTADALYAAPTGSNDDWYWLYAAIKFKCLIVTNDEMRDHLFQLLGKDFFPKWKERHQVHFSFSETGPVFHMPPPCSVVIQESERGHWHIPIASEFKSHGERAWLCITRTGSLAANLESSNTHDDLRDPHDEKKGTSSDFGRKLVPSEHGNHGLINQAPQEIYKSLKNILSSSLLSDSHSILPDLEDAEDFGGCTIDFQI